MHTKTAMLAGAAATAIAACSAQALPAMAEPIPPAASYAELLEPVPDAFERLRADDAGQAEPRMIQAQSWSRDYADHHHHHHHHRSARWYRDNGYRWDGYRWQLRRVNRDHHHHHHHHHDGW